MWHLLGDVSAAGGAQAAQQSCSVCAAPGRAQTLPTCVCLQLHLHSDWLRIALATPGTNCKGFILKPKKAHVLSVSLPFSHFLHHSNQFWADGPTAALSGMLCVLGALCSLISEPKLTQLPRESVGVSGVCLPVPQKDPCSEITSLVAPVSSRTPQGGEVCDCWSCIALLAKTLPCCSQKTVGAFSMCQNFRAWRAALKWCGRFSSVPYTLLWKVTDFVAEASTNQLCAHLQPQLRRALWASMDGSLFCSFLGWFCLSGCLLGPVFNICLQCYK